MADHGAGNGLIVAYEAGNHLHRYGARVYADGRYEQFSTGHPAETPNWEPYEPFSERATRAIADAVDAALAASIPDRISAGDPPPPDAATAHVTLRDREIEVGNWPKNAPPELQKVLDTIAGQRRRAPTPSTWELWSRGDVVALEVGCDVGDVEALHALDDALFMTGAAPGDAPAGDDPPRDTPLVRVTFSGRDGDDVLSVFADGRRVERSAAGKTTESHLGDDELAAVRRALAATDWAALPSPLC
ncbi:MAG TPA: hypothetical protein VFN44_17000 [Solirubrobacteraceae bacterium]|nr:hypothetical protein [Solirubrobacteraceae bacterium]